MKRGLKSLLFGVHQFIIHPICVSIAWNRLYGKKNRSFPLNIAFIVHDWGYYQFAEMDSPEGETHIELGGKIMDNLYGPSWGQFTRRHSRFYCRANDLLPSGLCYADKLAIFILPKPIYIALANASGELDEYLELAFGEGTKYSGEGYSDYDGIQIQNNYNRKQKIDIWYAKMKKTLDKLVEDKAYDPYIMTEIEHLIPYVPYDKRLWRR